MRDYPKFFINGEWVDPKERKSLDVIDPATEDVAGRISVGAPADLDRAVEAAQNAFPKWAATSREERIDALERIVAEFEKRVTEMAEAITEEMGAPKWLAEGTQAPIGIKHFQTNIKYLKTFEFWEDRETARVVKEPIGVCGFITPWNWPIHQISAKVAPALAMGNTVILKPSEIAPFSGQIFAEIVEAAGLPKGVFNMVQGEGEVIGQGIAAHPGIDMVSITGSTRAGIAVAKAAADTVKRVHQELGGKSPNIILDDADLDQAIPASVSGVMVNSGLSCRAPTRLLAPNKMMDEVCEKVREAAETWEPGDPKGNAKIGPVAYDVQWEKVRQYINRGLEEGAELVTGGADRPDGLDKGYYIKPTVFRNVTNDMDIAREEIFGPVLCVLGYDSEEEALEIANDTDYGLAGYVQGTDMERVRKVASKIRAGYISLNGAGLNLDVPFGGYKQSGNGREFSDYAFDEFCEMKSILGHNPDAG